MLSITVYTLTAIVLFGLGWHVAKREERSLRAGGGELPFASWEIVLSIILFACVAGARYHTGYDHAAYLNRYIMYGTYGYFTRSMECGFDFITIAFVKLGIHYFFYFALWAALQIGLIYYALRKHKHLLPWVGALLMTGYYFLMMMNSIRQSVVMAMLMASMPLIENRKFFKFLIVTAMGCLIHQSAILLLLVYFIPKRPRFMDNLKVALPLFLLFVALGCFPYWMKLLDGVASCASSISYDRYSRQIELILNGGFRSTHWGPSRIMWIINVIVMIVMGRAVCKFYKSDSLIVRSFTFCYVGYCLSNLFINTSPFMLRPFEYLTSFSLIVIASEIHYLYKSRKYVYMVPLALMNFSYVYFEIYKAVYRASDVTLPTLYNLFFLS